MHASTGLVTLMTIFIHLSNIYIPKILYREISDLIGTGYAEPLNRKREVNIGYRLTSSNHSHIGDKGGFDRAKANAKETLCVQSERHKDLRIISRKVSRNNWRDCDREMGY